MDRARSDDALSKKQKKILKIVEKEFYTPETGKLRKVFQKFANKSNNTSWFCVICKCRVVRSTIISHAKDSRHNLLLEQQEKIYKEQCESKSNIIDEITPSSDHNLQHALDRVEDRPLVGVEYMLELLLEDRTSLYTCTLCDLKCRPIPHLSSHRHIMMYVQTHFKSAHRHFGTHKVKDIKEEHKLVLEKLAWAIERTYGRLKHHQLTMREFNGHAGTHKKAVKRGQHFDESDGQTFEGLVMKELARVENGGLSKMADNEVSSTTFVEMEQDEKPSCYDFLYNGKDFEGPIEKGKPFGASENKEYEKKLVVFHELVKGIEEDMNEVLLKHRQNPDGHPQYNEEWKKFWKTRHMELLAEGKDPLGYNYNAEWKQFWAERMLELHNEETESKKIEVKKMLGLLDKPMSIATSPVMNSNREVVLLDDYDEYSRNETRERSGSLSSMSADNAQESHNIRIPSSNNKSPLLKLSHLGDFFYCREDASPTYSPPRSENFPSSGKRSPLLKIPPSSKGDSQSCGNRSPLLKTIPSLRNSPFGTIESPDLHRYSPCLRTDSPSPSRNSSTCRGYSVSRHKASPLLNRYSPSHSRNSPSRFRVSPSRSRDSPTRRRYSPSRRKGSHRLNRDRSSRHSPGRLRVDSPTRRTYSPSHTRDSPSHSRNSPSCSRNSPSRLRVSPFLHKDSPSLSRDSPSRSRNSPSHRKRSPCLDRDSPSRSRHSPGRLRISPFRRKDSSFRCRDSPTFRRYSPFDSKDFQPHRRFSPLRRRKSPSSRSKSPSCHKDKKKRESPMRCWSLTAVSDRRSRSIEKSSDITRKRKRDSYNSYKNTSNDPDIKLTAVLRQLIILADQLESLGPYMIDLSVDARTMETKTSNSSEELLDIESNCILFESVRTKLIDKLKSGLVDDSQEKIFETALKNVQLIIERAKQRKLRKRQESSENMLVVPGVGVVDKKKISMQIVDKLLDQGKRDITQEELDEMIQVLVKKDVPQPAAGYRSTNSELNQQEKRKIKFTLKKYNINGGFKNALSNYPDKYSHTGGIPSQQSTNQQPPLYSQHIIGGGHLAYQPMSARSNLEWGGAQNNFTPETRGNLSIEMAGIREGNVDFRDGLSSHRVEPNVNMRGLVNYNSSHRGIPTSFPGISGSDIVSYGNDTRYISNIRRPMLNQRSGENLVNININQQFMGRF